MSEDLALKLHFTLLETNHLMQRRRSEGNGNVIAIAAAAVVRRRPSEKAKHEQRDNQAE